jgi:glycosyltransferase involved in cell wall biosynthesis
MMEATDTEALADAMHRLAIDSLLREKLIQRGYEQAAKFGWDGAARRLLDVYSMLARG